MAKKKKQNNWITPTLILIGILILGGLFYYGGTQGWFKSNIDITQTFEENLQNPPTNPTGTTCTLDMTPNNVCTGDPITGTLTDGKDTQCYLFANWGEGWKNVYSGFTNSNGIWKEIQTIDFAGDYDFRGFCDINDDGQYTPLIDCYTNLENLIVNDCTPDPVPPTYNNGDYVGGTEGDGIIIDNGLTDEIDLGDLPPTGEGDCKLQALINTNWDYSTLSLEQQLCVGIQGQEGMVFTFSDSVGQVWSRNDYTPTALGSATDCGLIWDGETPFRFTADRITGFPDCEIELDYDISIVTCECE